MKMRKITVSLACLIILLISLDAHAIGVTLGWDPNSESDLDGYKIYYGKQSGVYDWDIDVGDVTTYRVEGLDFARKYWLAVTAYDFTGNESGYSAEVTYVTPVIPDTTPPGAPTGVRVARQ